MSDAPPMVLPPPAPQNELDGLRAGYGQPPLTDYANPPGANPGPSPEARLHPDMTRHPTNKQFTKNPANRSK